MDYLPIFLDLRGRACLVVGGGTIALRKVELLVAAGAAVRIVAPEVCAELRTLATSKRLKVLRRPYAVRDLRGAHVVIAATNRPRVNARVAADARKRTIPVNVVDVPALCSFIMPSIVDRGALVVAVSTGGASPVLARLTREKLDAFLHPDLGRLATFAGRHRAMVQRRLPDLAARIAFWEQILDGKVGKLALRGQRRAANAALRDALRQAQSRASV